MIEQNYIQLSAVQHYLFCPRQCAFIHLEQQWEENLFTALGNNMHEKVHQEKDEKRGDTIKSHAVYISSAQYGLSGQADLIEYYKVTPPTQGIKLPKHSGYWQPFPVEYKRGKPKKDNCDKVQLCAQALCLEEMHHCPIPNGALYYGEKKHRLDVEFTPELRAETIQIINKVHSLFQSRQTPKPIYTPKCRSCSLFNQCKPKQFEKDKSSNYIKKMFEEK